MKKIICLSGLIMLLSLQVQAQTLEEYFVQAAKNNPSLQAKYKSFEALLEKIPQVNSLPDPTLSFGYFISPVETRVGPQRARLSFNQMFPWFGTLKASGDVAALNADAQYQSFLDERNKLYYKVAAAFYPLYELNRWLELERENAEILESYKRIATTKFKNTEGSLVDALRVDLMLKDSQTNIEILEEKKLPLLSLFNQLLNRDEFEPVETPDSLLIPDDPEVYPKDSVYKNNPVIQELEYKINASKAQEILAEKQGLPKLGLGLDYMIVGTRDDLASGTSIADDGQDALMPMVSFSIPLYRGKYRAAKKEAQLKQQAYTLQRVNTINTLTSGYEMGIFELSQQSQLVALYHEQIDQTKQVLNLLLTAYGNSGKEFEEVLRVQQQLLKYQKMKATALMKYHISLAKLQYLTAKKF
ncbi:transporter [Roseivirga spongicola]|uniref:Transporter n=1 Tax=Roseivirga spongicola TaxID=333140 RepID=A0A150XEY7_9BACT|nr:MULTISPECIES: TolC family protein [Roseivirga]KYG77252.1 transporter [Roseivirga spongicola]MBO6662661.1 TolC family protein [Roseivirga sp.]MBO6909668.1 TolC family protein [Roseivirga sp.]